MLAYFTMPNIEQFWFKKKTNVIHISYIYTYAADDVDLVTFLQIEKQLFKDVH